MPRNPQISLNLSRLDHSGEIGRTTINTATAEDLVAGLSTEGTDFLLAIADVTDGLLISEASVQTKKIGLADFATAGQREDKWLCTYHDTTNLAIYQLELPCRKSTVVPPGGTDDVNLAVSPWVNFKTKFEAYVVSPDGNTTVLDRVTLVGRNV